MFWVAGSDSRPGGVLSRNSARDGSRHPLLLGGQDGYDGVDADGQAAFQGGTDHLYSIAVGGEAVCEKLSIISLLLTYT